MKTSPSHWLTILCASAMIMACGAEEQIPAEPIQVALIADLTSSQASHDDSIPKIVHEVARHIYDSILPIGSEIAVFTVGPSSLQPPLFTPYTHNTDAKNIDAQIAYLTRKKSLQARLRKDLTEAYQGERSPLHAVMGRSCIDNAILAAAKHLQSRPPGHARRLIIISDFLQQCDKSEMAGGRPLWLANAGQAPLTSLDSAQSLRDRWDHGQPLNGVEVHMVPITSKSIGTLSESQLIHFWKETLEHLGASKVTESSSIPPTFLSPTP